MAFSNFMKSIGNDENEGRIIKSIMISLAVSLLVIALAYYTKVLSESIFSKYSLLIFLLIIGYAITVSSFRYVLSFGELHCMAGMMIGMSIGMASGFLAGFFIGATNGMAVGGIFGMIIGAVLGVWSGKCSGIMGVMEGIMAGMMSGLMGAMTAVMTLNDHLKITGFFVFIFSVLIVLCLNYMVYKETGKNKPEKISTFFDIFWTLLLIGLTLALMISGPRSFLIQ